MHSPLIIKPPYENSMSAYLIKQNAPAIINAQTSKDTATIPTCFMVSSC